MTIKNNEIGIKKIKLRGTFSAKNATGTTSRTARFVLRGKVPDENGNIPSSYTLKEVANVTVNSTTYKTVDFNTEIDVSDFQVDNDHNMNCVIEFYHGSATTRSNVVINEMRFYF